MKKRFAAHSLLALLLVAVALFSSQQSGMAALRPRPGEMQPPLAPAGPLTDSFAAAAKEFDLPQAILLAIGYDESRWEQQVPDRHNDGSDHSDGGWGVMHLVENPGNDSLARAAALLKLDPLLLKERAEQNIRGAAALLRSFASRAVTASSPLEAWQPAIGAYSAAIHPGVDDMYLAEIYKLLAQGAGRTTSSGERLTLAATAVDLSKLAPAVQAEMQRKSGLPASTDYPPAHWNPAYSGNYQVANRPSDQQIDRIIIHDTEGSYAASISWFQNPNSHVSAHYMFRSSDGDLTQLVQNKDIGYHAGNWPYNQHAIGIEHEGYANDPTAWYTQVMYQNSATLTRYLADYYGIMKDRRAIISHKNVPNQPAPGHWDPGPGWDFASYLALVRGDSNMDTNIDNLDSTFHPVPTTVNAANHWYTATGSTYGSNALYSYSAASTVSSTNYAVWRPYLQAGSYDLYVHIPYANTGMPDTNHAVYTVGSVAGATTVVVDQGRLTDGLANMNEMDSLHGQWAQLGRFTFETGTTGYVKLTDQTGEDGRTVWFDAAKFIPIEGGGPPITATPWATGTPALPSSTPTNTRLPATATPQPATATQQPPTASPPPTTSPPLTASPVSTFTPGLCGINFADLPNNHWAYGYISNLYCAGIMSGYDDGLFHPGYNMNRAQFAKMLTLSLGWSLTQPLTATFSDVPLSHWASRYIETAASYSAMSGYNDGGFHPGLNMTRAQVAASIVRARGFSSLAPSNPTFSDVARSYWAWRWIEVANSVGIVSGYSDGSFKPDSFSDRAQMAKIIRRSITAPTPAATLTPTAGPTATLTPTASPTTVGAADKK